MPPLTIRLNPADNVVVARVDLLPGTEVEGIAVRVPVPAGHKLATAPIAAGEPVRKYGQILGFATEAIAPGEHVHTHNLGDGRFRARLRVRRRRPADRLRARRRARHLRGHRARRRPGRDPQLSRRADHRELLGHAPRALSREQFHPGAARRVPRISTASSRSATAPAAAWAAKASRWTCCAGRIAGYARHPNFAGVLILGLGCEVEPDRRPVARRGAGGRRPFLQAMTIQDTGGTHEDGARGRGAAPGDAAGGQ